MTHSFDWWLKSCFTAQRVPNLMAHTTTRPDGPLRRLLGGAVRFFSLDSLGHIHMLITAAALVSAIQVLMLLDLV